MRMGSARPYHKSWLVGLLLISGLLAGCLGDRSEPTPTPTEEATATPIPTLAHGQRLRWGYDPRVPTGEEDPPVAEKELPDGYRIEQVLTGLDRPTQLAVIPDGRMLVAEQAGRVRVVQDGRLLEKPLVSLEVYLPLLDSVVELGLTGIAVDPDFEQSPYIYLYYAADEPRRTVIARVRDDGRGELEELMSWERAPVCCHIGGGLRFAPDGTLFIGVGEHELPNESQTPLTPLGSILRLNRDGSWPDDNPFGGPVYAYGLRNPYDIAIDPKSGRVFAGENGLYGQDAVVEVKAGANYGWPGFNLSVPLEEIEEPLIFYHTAAGLAGMEFYSRDVLSELQGHLLFCRFHSGTIHDIEFSDDGTVLQESILPGTCHSDILTGADGFLYFLDYVEGTLRRIAADAE